MDLNELLHAHQIEVMKASASDDAVHYGRIAEYAERVRQLRTVPPSRTVAQHPAAPPTIIYGSYAGDPPREGGAQPRLPTADVLARADSENPDRGAA